MRVRESVILVLLLVAMSSTYGHAQANQSWAEDSVAVKAQVEAYQLKIDKISKNTIIPAVVGGVSSGIFLTHAGILFNRGFSDGGLIQGFSDAFDNEVVQIEAAAAYGSALFLIVQGLRINTIQLRQKQLLKTYDRRYLKVDDGYEIVPIES